MEQSKSQIIIRLLKQIYSLIDEVCYLKEKVEELEKHKLENPDSYEIAFNFDIVVKENKNLVNTIENLRNELKILRNGKK
jgi:hypothetical protein